MAFTLPGARWAMSDDASDTEHPDDDLSPDRRRDARALLPAVYIDTWSTLIWSGHMRITLGEWLGEDPSYRGAFIMELDDAERLARHILRRAQRQRERDAAKLKKQQETEGRS